MIDNFWQPFWYGLSTFSVVNWIVGFITGWLPGVIIVLSLTYWCMKLWETVTGHHVKDTRWAKWITRKVLRGKHKTEDDSSR